MLKLILKFLFILLLTKASTCGAAAESAEYVRGVCEINSETENEIKECLRETSEDICDDIPAEQKRDCFDRTPLAEQKTDFINQCAIGGVNGVADFFKSIGSFFAKNAKAISSPKEFQKTVRTQAYQNCASDLEIKRQEKIVEGARKNLKYYEDMKPSIDKLNVMQMQCVFREIRKGQPNTIDLSLPKMDQLRALYSCLRPQAQTEIACSVIVPGLASGVAGAALLKAAKDLLFMRRLSKDVKIALGDRIEKLRKEGKLTPAELKSIEHQEDLLSYFKSRGVAQLIEKYKIDTKSMVDGIIDSDLGKLDKYKVNLSVKSEDSSYLLKGIQLQGNSPGQIAMKQFAREHMDGKAFLDPPVKIPTELQRRLDSTDRVIAQAAQTELVNLKSDFIRSVFSKVGSGSSLFHEWGGFLDAMKALDKHEITYAQFENRMLTNMNHNSFGQGFGKDILIPTFEKGLKDGGFHDFLSGSYYGGSEVDGFVRAKYPMPESLSGVIHTVADRVSGATTGPIKFIYEMAGNQIKSEMDPITMGKLNLFGKNGLEAIQGLFLDGKGGSPFGSNAMSVGEQLKSLNKFVAKDAKFLTTEQSKDMSSLVRAGQQRVEAFRYFTQPPNIEYELNAAGKPIRINFKSPPELGGKYIGTIAEDTPQHEAMQTIQKFLNEEKRIFRDPMTDLMSPRLLTKTELIQAGLLRTGTYMYCNSSGAIGRGVISQKPEASTAAGSQK